MKTKKSVSNEELTTNEQEVETPQSTSKDTPDVKSESVKPIKLYSVW